MKLRRLFLVLITLSACSDSTDPGSASGSLSFSYSGSVGSSTLAGTYNASGSPPLNISQRTTPWALGQRYEDDQAVAVMSNLPKSGGTVDVIDVYFPQLTTGTMQICFSTACGNVDFTFGHTPGTLNAQYTCSLESGTVTLTSLSETRARGTFSGSGECVDVNSPPGNPAITGPVTITNGTFDVPLLPNPEGG